MLKGWISQKIWFHDFGVILEIFHYRITKAILFSPSKVIFIFWREQKFFVRMECSYLLEGLNCQKNMFDSFWRFLHQFTTRSPMLFSFGHLQNFHFLAKSEHFAVDMDAFRCLKAKCAKFVFLTFFGDFSTILLQNHQN